MSNGEPGCKDLVQQGSASLSLNYLSSSDENMTEKTVWEKKKERKKGRRGQVYILYLHFKACVYDCGGKALRIHER